MTVKRNEMAPYVRPVAVKPPEAPRLQKLDPPFPAPGSAIPFYFFVLMTGIFVIRPGDMSPALADVPFYFTSLVICTILAGYNVVRQLDYSLLSRQPITLIVIGITICAILSNLLHGDLYDSREAAVEAAVLLSYFLLFTVTVNTTQRLRWFLIWTTLFVLLLCLLGLGQYEGLIDVQAPPTPDMDDTASGDIPILRLTSVGMYNNPNDLARILLVGVVLAMYCQNDRSMGLLRHLWAIPGAICLYGMYLTYSRGGFLAMLAAFGSLIVGKLSPWKRIFVAAAVLPALFLVFHGRTTEISTSEGTGKDRIEIWRDGFVEMKSSPLFGIGVGKMGDTLGLWAHNSFVQGFVETGVIGGTLFAGAFYVAWLGPVRVRKHLKEIPDPELVRMRPFLVALIVGSIVGMFSSTRNFRVDTYMLLGIAAAYMTLMCRHAPSAEIRMSRKLALQICGVGAATLLFFNVFVRISS